jgi:hypothetical protein
MRGMRQRQTSRRTSLVPRLLGRLSRLAGLRRSRAGGRRLGSGRVWTVHVHDEEAVADERDNELLGLVQWVHVTVDEAGGHVEEAARLHIGALPAPGAELEAEATPDDVPEHFAIAVVVPARGDAAVDTPADVQGALCGERDLPHDSGRRIARRQSIQSDRGNSIRMCHASRSSSEPRG